MSPTAPRPRTIRQGLTAGLFGALAVAAWFLTLDLAAGQPGRTPALLGHAFFSAFGPVTAGSSALIAMYTVVHLTAFSGVGLVAAALLEASRREPTLLAGLAVLAVVLEVLFTGIVATMAEGTLGDLAWQQIGAANLVAAAVMGTYLARQHPALGASLAQALGGREA
jgi:hypothetical protein